MNPLYNLSDGWFSGAEKQPELDMSIWLWTPKEKRPCYVSEMYGARVQDGDYWKPAIIPPPPRRYTEHELERKLCLNMWRGRSLDFAEHQWSDLPQDWIDGWMAARKASKIQATSHST